MNELTEELESRGDGKRGSASTLWSFVHQIKKGDVVVANNGLSRVAGIGIITSDYLPPVSKKNPNRQLDGHRQVRLVDWVIKNAIDLGQRVFNQPTLQLLTSEQSSQVKKAYWDKQPQLRTTLNRLFPGQLPDDDGGNSAFETNDPYQPTSDDLRQTMEREIKVRRGQKAFRDSLLNQHGKRCMVTGCEDLAVLEAAHISPYRGANDNHVENGLVLRADIHTLFDLNLLGINPDGLTLKLHPDIACSPHYGFLAGRTLDCSADRPPSFETLQHRYEVFEESMANR